jgi:sugar lactone lactonase YvrE
VPDGGSDGAASVAPTQPLPLEKILAARGEFVSELGAFPEGPSYRRSDGSVFVCASSLVRIAPDKKRTRLLSIPCLGTLVLADGSLLMTGQGGLYQITKPETGGRVALLAEDANANDLSLDRKGNVYFTGSGGKVLRLSPEGPLEALTTGLPSANGVEVDAEDRYVYVTQSSSAGRLVRFDLPALGKAFGAPFVILEGLPIPDGVTLDAWGNLWLALHEVRKIGIVDPKARKELGRIDVPVMFSIQNLTFGGPNLDALYIAGGRYGANAQLWRFPVGAQGAPPKPGAAAYKPKRMLDEVVAEKAY